MDTQTFSHACGGPLKLRLGQWECAQCAAPAGTCAAQGGATTAKLYDQRDELIAAQGSQDLSRETNVTAKRWIVGLFAFLNLLPSIGWAGGMVYFFYLWNTMGGGSEPMPGELSMLTKITLIVIAFTFVFDAISVFVFYLMLFSDVLWL